MCLCWCVVGDFNMIEYPNDRKGGSVVKIHGVELVGTDVFEITYFGCMAYA